MPRRSWRFASLAFVVLAGCAVQESTPSTGVGWREHDHLGRVLVDGEGRTLYVHRDDPHGHPSRCVGPCADLWPPFTLEGTLRADPLAGRIGTIAHEQGGRQVTIDARPLHHYADDEAPGHARGQGRGGGWTVVRAADQPGRLNAEILDGPGEHEVRGEELAGASAPGYLARPEGAGSFPGIVMVHEWWGLNENIRAMARALASHGYVVLAVDLFGGRVATTPEEARDGLAAFDEAQALTTLRGAAGHLRAQGVPTLGVLGWCFGGGEALRLAVLGEPLDATVVFYGRLVTDPAELRRIEHPVLGIFGEEDENVPPEEVRAFEDALEEAGVDAEIRVYENVGHAFANPSGEAYAPEEAMRAWARTLRFLDRTLR